MDPQDAASNLRPVKASDRGEGDDLPTVAAPSPAVDSPVVDSTTHAIATLRPERRTRKLTDRNVDVGLINSIRRTTPSGYCSGETVDCTFRQVIALMKLSSSTVLLA